MENPSETGKKAQYQFYILLGLILYWSYQHIAVAIKIIPYALEINQPHYLKFLFSFSFRVVLCTLLFLSGYLLSIRSKNFKTSLSFYLLFSIVGHWMLYQLFKTALPEHYLISFAISHLILLIILISFFSSESMNNQLQETSTLLSFRQLKLIAPLLLVGLTFFYFLAAKDRLALYREAHKEMAAGNKDKAIVLYEKSCDENTALSCYNLGLIFSGANDTVRAKDFSKKACELDYALGCNNVGTFEEKEGNNKIAKEFYLKACSKGALLGCANLATRELNDGNIDSARRIGSEACAKGSYESCYNVGVIDLQAGKVKEAEKLFSQSCEKGIFKGCYNHAILVKDQKNFKLARELFLKSCDGKVLEGCTNLGLLLVEEGRNIKEGLTLISQACDSGESHACQIITELNKK